ncbi:MAG: Maf family protein [Alcanivorax sp.]
MTANSQHKKLILASASPRRLDLLGQLNITPDDVIAADIDESPNKDELPRQIALRLAVEKAQKIREDHKDAFIIAADTVVACGRREMPKALNEDDARKSLTLLSGRRHHVYGGICVITPEGKTIPRLCDTVVKFKRLSPQEIEAYLNSGEWEGKAGGYAIQGLAAGFISNIQGSYSNVVGLSLYDIMQLLSGNNFFVKTNR